MPAQQQASSDAAPRAMEHPQLKAYLVFSEALSPISQTSADRIVDILIRIVGVEGPVTGWRIHQVYRKCATVRESHDDFSRLLNRVISAAERKGAIVSENPLNESGNKPRTFRLPSQPSVVARELGTRTIDIVPSGEVLQYCRSVSAGQGLSENDLIERVGKLLRNRHLVSELREAVAAAKRIDARIAAPPARTSTGPIPRRSEGVCPSCFTIHAGECA
ncbi:hypothetical protein QGN32_23100 [Mycolicibacterium sp. ND9-15]|uniref:hypothetical protein n=1 Tax=Mycolicibacterium sp. ND9-15 TaxID=3042320 RepID=UPI002DDAC211|nr:hypothetical protein [Mycolicibacterium sp. ND9-15]WSE56186.1 hypothetical protein QGN32_23100 [Mycolicibacterium sp. ND9-15]